MIRAEISHLSFEARLHRLDKDEKCMQCESPYSVNPENRAIMSDMVNGV